MDEKGDKQFRRSRRTTDRRLAERRLSELRQQVGNLCTEEDPTVGFVTLADFWLETVQHTPKPSTMDRRRRCIKALAPFLRNLTVRNVTRRHCEPWLSERGGEIAPQTFAHELGTMRAVFNYGIDPGLILANPSKDIKRRKIVSKPIQVPSRDDLQRLVATIRESDGRLSSQAKAKEGADLVELLAYSGCRLDEVRNLRWQDVSFDHKRVTSQGLNRTRLSPRSAAGLQKRVRTAGTSRTAVGLAVGQRVVAVSAPRRIMASAEPQAGRPRNSATCSGHEHSAGPSDAVLARCGADRR